MAKWTSKYGTVIDIPDGLSAKQINEIKTQANNKYGTKAQELAKQYGAQVGKGGAGGQGAAQPQPIQVVNPVAPIQTGVNANGTINGAVAAGTIAGAALGDQTRTIQGQNANETDALGNTVNTVVNPDGTVSRTTDLGAVGTQAKDAFTKAVGGIPSTLDLNGAPKILQTGDYKDSWNQAQNSLYNVYAQNLDRNQDRALETQKQELANRGFVYNPGDPNSGYGKAIGGVNEDYAAQRANALDRSIAGATAQMTANAGVQTGAYDSFLKGATAVQDDARANVGTAAGALGASQGNFQAFQGAGTDIASQLAQIAAMEQSGAISAETARIQRAALNKSGGGGGSSSNNSGVVVSNGFAV